MAPLGSAASELYASFAASSHIPVLLVDRDGVLLAFNHGAEQVYGYAASEVLGTSVLGTVPRELHAEACALLARAFAGERVLAHETRRVCKGGRTVEVSLSCSPVRDPAGAVVAVAESVDVSAERVAAEQLFQTVFEACPSGMLLVDRTGQVILANAEAAAQLGYGPGGLLGLSVHELLAHPEQGDADLRAYFAAAERSRSPELPGFTARRRDGTPFPVELALNPVRVGDDDFVLCVVADMTERRAAERRERAYQLKLEQSNRDLQQFAYVASHDLKEPLRVVQAYAELLLTKWAYALDDRARKYVGHIHDESRRALALVHDLLSFARIDQGAAPAYQALATTQLVADVVASLTASWPRAQLASQITVAELPAVLADPAQLRQVFHNLLSNALKFVRPGELPSIAVTGERTRDEVVIHVADRGIGIDGDAPVFDMFGRAPTRTRYEGHGVGLAIVQRIVARHGGRVWHAPRAGGGTTFSVALPAPPEAP
jgi:PAS domain S-box-containing protein